jgi:hypothetical protein
VPAPGRITNIRIDSDPDAWAGAGFVLDGSSLRVGGSLLELGTGCRGNAGALCRWSLAGFEPGEMDGLPTDFDGSVPEADPPEHPNTSIGVDHVVVFSSELERTIASFAESGIECRRVREVPIAEDRTRQAFFRIGATIVEVIQVPADKAGPEGRSRFWGLAFAVADIDAAAELLGPLAGRVRDAVQPGRRIAPIRREAGLGVSVALITRDPATRYR